MEIWDSSRFIQFWLVGNGDGVGCGPVSLGVTEVPLRLVPEGWWVMVPAGGQEVFLLFPIPGGE